MPWLFGVAREWLEMHFFALHSKKSIYSRDLAAVVVAAALVAVATTAWQNLRLQVASKPMASKYPGDTDPYVLRTQAKVSTMTAAGAPENTVRSNLLDRTIAAAAAADPDCRWGGQCFSDSW
jgi:hypothetical protein